MQEKLAKFFDSIGYKDSEGYFNDAHISKVVLNKKKESFEVFIENDRPINPLATFELLKASKNGINGEKKCHINFIYNDMDDEDIKKCFGILANMNFLLVCEYGENGSNPEIIIYKKR